MKILVTGGNGYIGSNLYADLSCDFNVVKISRSDVDLLDPELVNRFFANNYFDVIIHTAFQGGSRLKEDKIDVLDNNLIMYYNILRNRHKFKRFINIGSGADIYSLDKPYGLSKYIIRRSLEEKQDFYNLRVFGIFNHAELSTRFIKSNMINYLNRRKMIVNEDKLMDFVFMDDFISIVRYFIINDKLPKNYDCVYSSKFYLSEILKMINKLGDYVVDTHINSREGNDYIGKYIPINVEYIGLEMGLKQMYDKLILTID